jgi:hypothetical protein
MSGGEQQPSAEKLPFDTVRWDRKGSMLVVAADRTLASVLGRITQAAPAWIVVVRSRGPHVYRYAYRGEELRQHATDFLMRASKR